MKTLTKQYMEYIDEMKELEINVASEYLVMASELLKIKSHMLLPEPPHLEEEYEDPRESLMEQLIEYQNYKQYAEQLKDRRHPESVRNRSRCARASVSKTVSRRRQM